MLEERQAVKMCGPWQVQSMTKLAHASKYSSQFSELGIEGWVTYCPKLLRV